MMVVPNANEAFLPLPDEMLVNLSESYDIILSLLDNFHNYFTNQGQMSTQESNFVAALNCAQTISKHIGGKILLFQVSQTAIRAPQLAPPTAQAKDNPNDKFGPSNLFFANTASELAHLQISVDLFLFTHGKGHFKNIFTFAELAKKSSGNLFFYPDYNQYSHGMKFTNELYTNLTRANAWEAVFRIRTSLGFNQTGTFGNFLIKQKTTDLLICPTIDKDRVLTYEIERAPEIS